MSTAPRAPLMSLDDALQALLARISPLTDAESVATFDADGRVLAEDLVSALQVPAFDNSSMDGYAVRRDDLLQPGAKLRVSQRIAAGHTGQALQPGQTARIFTGALVPEGADAIVMQEQAEPVPGEADAVRFTVVPEPGQWIRRSGEDIREGQTALHCGQKLGPAEVGLAASLGLAHLPVLRRPRVALFSTGDELVMPGDVAPQDMPPGSIYNSNRFFLRTLLQRMG